MWYTDTVMMIFQRHYVYTSSTRRLAATSLHSRPPTHQPPRKAQKLTTLLQTTLYLNLHSLTEFISNKYK